MKKALIISTVSRQFPLFERGNIEILKELGYEVHGAANYSDANIPLDKLKITNHHINIQRNPFSIKNIGAYNELLSLIKKENYDLVHCHSPMGGVLGRLAGRKAKVKNILYTAHGFHFFKGSPLVNWICYFPIEWICSFFTDILITINEEDYKLANKLLCMRKVYNVPGIGIDISRFKQSNINREKKRKEFNIAEDDIILLSIGELSKRKNHELAIRALAQFNNSNLHYYIVGKGKLEEYLKSLCESLGVSQQVHFLGFQKNIEELCSISDIFIFPSKQEGLPVSVMEAMASKLPIIASDIRGNKDLILHEKGGYLVPYKNLKEFKKRIELLVNDKKLRERMGIYNLEMVENYKKDIVKDYMREIYSNLK